MRYIVIPDAEAVVVPSKGAPGKAEPERFSFYRLLDENVWTNPLWRKDEKHAAVFDRLVAAFDGAAAAGTPYVGVSDEDFEVFAPVATLQGLTVHPQMVRALNRLTRCVTFAPSVPPSAERRG